VIEKHLEEGIGKIKLVLEEFITTF
jgi:hypothetical protein